jgi:hypothetical protein
MTAVACALVLDGGLLEFEDFGARRRAVRFMNLRGRAFRLKDQQMLGDNCRGVLEPTVRRAPMSRGYYWLSSSFSGIKLHNAFRVPYARQYKTFGF